MGVLGSIYRPKRQYSTVSTVFVVVVRHILGRFLSVRYSIRIVGRFLSVAVRCQRRFRRRISTELIGSCSSTMQGLSVQVAVRLEACQFRQQYGASDGVGSHAYRREVLSTGSGSSTMQATGSGV